MKGCKRKYGISLGIELNTDLIRRILRKKFMLSYKRVSSRHINLDHELKNYKKILFAFKIWQQLNNSMTLINIDEALFTKSTKINYSWWKRGVSTSISNQVFRGSVSLVSSILMNGISITWTKSGTINSESFVE